MKKKEYKILWVDDKIENLTTYVLALEEAGFTVHTASSVSDAQKLVGKKGLKYHAILVDLRMGEEDSISFLRDLSELQPDARLAAFSSYLYQDDYLNELKNIGFNVELMDKDIAALNSKNFKDNFIRPIERLIRLGEKETVFKQEKQLEKLAKRKNINPFNITLNDYLKKPIKERFYLSNRAREYASKVLKEEFSKGSIWVLLCGGDGDVVATASSIDKVLSTEEIMKHAISRNKAPYQFFKSYKVDEWGDCGKEADYYNYPTLTFEMKNKAEKEKKIMSFHFDTGAPQTCFSFEDLFEMSIINYSDLGMFIDAKINGQSYISFSLQLTKLLLCQRDGQAKVVTINGIAISDWLNGPFYRPCHEKCGRYSTIRSKYGWSICPERIGIIGRNFLTDNKIRIVLNGKERISELG